MKAQSQITQTRKFISIFLLIVGVLVSTFNPGSLSPAQAQQAGAESLSGWLSTVWGDGRDGSLVRELHRLNTDDGRSVPLLLDASAVNAAGGLPALDGKWITVHGAWLQAPNAQSAARTFQVTSIAALPEADSASAAVNGSQKWITIMCKFQGNTSEPNPLSFFQNMYINAYPGLDHYWREQSYNLINTVGSTASGWYTLPRPRSYYLDGAWFNLDKERF